jgi:hypothetical protein
MLEFTTIRAFYEFLQVPQPPDEDFAIQRLEASQRLRAKLGAPVFRHRFYGISLQLTGNVHYQAGGQQRYMDQSFVFFSSCPLLRWCTATFCGSWFSHGLPPTIAS